MNDIPAEIVRHEIIPFLGYKKIIVDEQIQTDLPPNSNYPSAIISINPNEYRDPRIPDFIIGIRIYNYDYKTLEIRVFDHLLYLRLGGKVKPLYSSKIHD